MVVALTPALIIMMIASVAMFIYTIGYDGEYVKRGRFILFFFVTAVVLIARLSMDHGKEYAGLFAIPLILVMLFATKFSLLAMLGVGLVWWIAHQLTWNCTYIENAEGDPGTGLLQVIGADRERMIDDDDQTSEIDEIQSPEKESGGFADWWRKQIDRSHTQRTPGITVLYFAVVALPCFGFGQWFLGSEENRRIGMWLVMGYLASGFGLLMTTAFLGLRRYLRRRHVPMPPEVATAWLAGGTVLTLLLLSVCLVLPRPRAPLSRNSAAFSFGEFNFQRWDKFGFGRDGYQQEDANREGNAPKTAAAGTEDSKRKSNSGQQGNSKRQSSDNDKTGSKQAGQGKSGGESGSKGSGNKNAKGSQSKKGSGGGGNKSNKRGDESSPSIIISIHHPHHPSSPSSSSIIIIIIVIVIVIIITILILLIIIIVIIGPDLSGLLLVCP